MFPSLSLFFYLLCIAAVHMLRFIYYGWFLPYLELVLLAAPLLILLLSLPSMLSARLRVACPDIVEQRRGCEVRLAFRSRIPFTLSQVKLNIVTENLFTGDSELTEINYLNLSEESLLFPLPTEDCGKLVFYLTKWTCSDLLGFFFIRKRLPETVSCTVLPPVTSPPEGFHLDEALETEPVLKPKPGGGLAEDYDLREYRQGDMLNSIHWKLSSKTDKLIVREALVPENSDIFLVLRNDAEVAAGIGILRWLSEELCRRELPHFIVSGSLYTVLNEQDCLLALTDILSAPPAAPCSFDASKARCVLTVSAGEVHCS